MEALLSELKTKHTAEKRLLHCDMMLMKKLIKTMVDKIKEKKKENNKYEIRMIQIKKLQEINKKLKLDNEKLSKDNKVVVKMKNMPTIDFLLICRPGTAFFWRGAAFRRGVCKKGYCKF